MQPATKVIVKPLTPPVGEVIHVIHTEKGTFVKVRWPSGHVQVYNQKDLQVVSD